MPPIRKEQVTAGRILTAATGFMAQGGYDYTLNPYFGCTFSCNYCYASNFSQGRDRGAAWGEWLEVKQNAAQLIRKHTPLNGKAVYMSFVTDPYQPEEKEARVTRGVLEALAEQHPGVRLVVQTRGPLLLRDLDLLNVIAAQGTVQINVTVTTDDDQIRRAFEPSCASILRRMQMVKMCADAGLSSVITVTPMLPIRNVQAFAETLLSSGANKVILQPFHQETSGPNLRGTQRSALETLTGMNLTLADLKSQGNQLWKLLKSGGMPVGIGAEGFKAP